MERGAFIPIETINRACKCIYGNGREQMSRKLPKGQLGWGNMKDRSDLGGPKIKDVSFPPFTFNHSHCLLFR